MDKKPFKFEDVCYEQSSFKTANVKTLLPVTVYFKSMILPSFHVSNVCIFHVSNCFSDSR